MKVWCESVTDWYNLLLVLFRQLLWHHQTINVVTKVSKEECIVEIGAFVPVWVLHLLSLNAHTRQGC